MSSDGIKTVGELRKELHWVQTWKDKCVVVQRNRVARFSHALRHPPAEAIERILRYEPML